MDYSVGQIADHIHNYMIRRRVEPEVSKTALENQIYSYIQLRASTSIHRISVPPNIPLKPAGWTAEDERIWLQWIHYTCTAESWQREVMDPVFGTDVEPWEPYGEYQWRNEILEFMPWWIRRSKMTVAKFDPSPLEEEVEEDKIKGLDQYLLDHGSAKQRRKAAEY